MSRIAAPSSQLPYQNTSDYRTYVYPHGAQSPYANHNTLTLQTYPNTLSTQLPQELFQDLSGLAVDPATLYIIPDYLFEAPKQPDKDPHDLNLNNAFAYHRPQTSYTNSAYISPSTAPTNTWRHLMSPLFTDPSNHQVILPDGQIREVSVTPQFQGGPIDRKEANRIIYEAKKARGDEVVYDILGRPYTPDMVHDLTDSQDYVDESLRGQVDDYLRYNPIGGPDEDVEKTAQVAELYNRLTRDPSFSNFAPLPSGNFLSDYLGSTTALVSPLLRTGSQVIDQVAMTTPTISNFLVNSFSTETQITGQAKLAELDLLNISPESLYDAIKKGPNPTGIPSEIRVNLSDLRTRSAQAAQSPLFSDVPSLNTLAGRSATDTRRLFQPPPNNISAYPFNTPTVDYAGSEPGEWYHLMDFMRQTYAEIRQLDNQNVSQTNPEGFDIFKQTFGWMDVSPRYQEYLQEHVQGHHNGKHDLTSGRGFNTGITALNRNTILLEQRIPSLKIT